MHHVLYLQLDPATYSYTGNAGILEMVVAVLAIIGLSVVVSRLFPNRSPLEQARKEARKERERQARKKTG